MGFTYYSKPESFVETELKERKGKVIEMINVMRGFVLRLVWVMVWLFYQIQVYLYFMLDVQYMVE